LIAAFIVNSLDLAPKYAGVILGMTKVLATNKSMNSLLPSDTLEILKTVGDLNRKKI
jgi:hypothetical protein